MTKVLRAGHETYVLEDSDFPFKTDDPAFIAALEKTKLETQPKPEKIVQEQGVEMNTYLDYIKSELETESNCLQLPMTILLLVSFSFLAIAHLGQSQVHSVEEAIEFDIMENANFAWAHWMGHKGLIDVNSIPDFWSWIRLGFLPLIVQPTWSYSEAYPSALGTYVLAGTNYSQGNLPTQWKFNGYQKAAPVTNDYMRYNKIIGGIRMMQQIVDANYDDCRYSSEMESSWNAWFKKPCMKSSLAELPPELHETEFFDEIKRVEWLLPELDTLETMKHTLLDMEDGCNFYVATGRPLSSCGCTWCKAQNPVQPWIDEETLRVEVAFIVYNAVYGMYTYVGVNLFFNRGGHIHHFINCMTSWADPSSAPLGEQIPLWIANTLWVVANLYVMIMESKEIFLLIRHSSDGWWRAIRDEYLSIWNVIDWVSIIVSWLIVQFYIRYRFAVGDMNQQLATMMELANKSRGANEAANVTFFTLVQDMAAAEKMFRRFLSFYPQVVMMRLFKSFKAQKKLALVTDTMNAAAQDLGHFFLVFFTVFFCMIVNSMLFFGQDVEEFGSVPRAIHSCFRAMFGDYDWDLMKEIGFLKAGVWFWVFMIVMYLILLNMLLAIVMDAYSIVSQKAKLADPLWSTVSKMYRRWNETRKGERVKLNDVYSKFLAEFKNEKEMMKCDTKLKPDDVCARMDRMPRKQAARTLKSALERKIAQEEEKNHMDDEKLKETITDLLGNVEKRMNIIAEDSNYVKMRLNYYDRLQIPGDPEYDFHFGAVADGGGNEADLPKAIDDVSAEIGGVFVRNMKRIETMQESLEQQQEELHKLISEMEMMVDQQARCVQSISENMSALGSPRPALAESEAPP